MGVCCCLQACNLVVNMLVKGLVLSLAKYYGSELLLFTCCLQVTAHPIMEPNLCTKFQIWTLYGFWDTGFETEEQEEEEEAEKWTFCHISHASGPILTIRYTCILTLAIILWCQRWIISESENANWNFRMYRHNGPRSCPSLQSTTVLCDITGDAIRNF